MEGDIYSDPVEQKIGKKSATLDRKRSTDVANFLSPHFLTPEHTAGGSIDLDAAEGLSDYASVEDAFRHTEMTAGMVRSLRRQAKRTPSSSPPPLPPPLFISSETTPSTATIGDTASEQEGEAFADMYASVDLSHRNNRKGPSSPSRKRGPGYDHLVAGETPFPTGYDKLQPPERPPRTYLTKTNGSPSSSGGSYDPLHKILAAGKARIKTPPLPSSEEYATIGGSGGRDAGEGGDGLPMYATIQARGQSGSLPQPHLHSHDQQGGEDLYSVVNKPSMRSPPPPIVPRSKEKSRLDDMYSVPNPNRASNPNHGREGRNLGHHRMQSEDHILHSPAEPARDDHLYVKSPPLLKRAITPEGILYSNRDKKPERKTRPSSYVKQRSILTFGHSPIHKTRA